MKRLLFAAAVVFIGWYFFHNAGLGLRAKFTQDDLMNMYRSMETGYTVLLQDSIFFWRPSRVYRPFGELLYKVSLDLFGLDLWALSIARYLALCANLVLLYLLARRLSGSRETGLLAALLFSYHPGFSVLYYNTGTLYDIFSFLFFFAAFLWYVRIRQSGRLPRFPEVLGVTLLYILSLASKEIAVTLPALLVFYELLYHAPDLAPSAGPLRVGRALVTAAACLGVGLAYTFGRVLSKDGLASVGKYEPVYSIPEYLRQTGHYLIEVLYKPDATLPLYQTALFLLFLAVASLLFRSRVMGLSALLFAVGVLPVAFIPWRGLNAVLIPLAGLAVFVAAFLAALRDLAVRRLPAPLPARVALFALVAIAMVKIHPDTSGLYGVWTRLEYEPIGSFMRQVRELHPNVRDTERILVVKDPFGEFNWASLFITRLVYRAPALRVDRFDSMDPKPSAAEIAKYDIRLAWVDGRLRDVPASEAASVR
ncbi:MAG: glycosyltransferase family 39 protein [Bryobacterales bacterium]|nr:glycosyltransferase family 39 protein [Bryobacterales bacterium]